MSLKSVPGVSVIMPTLNEAGHIQDLIQTTINTLRTSGIGDYEVILVDDDSQDCTWQVAAETPGIEKDKLRVIRRLRNHGLTASISEGIKNSKYDVVVWMDCDFSHPPEKIPQLLYMLGEGYDVVVNSRYVIGGGEDRIGKGGIMQLFLSKVLNWGTRFILKPAFSDYTSGFIAVRKEIVDTIPLNGDYGEYFVEFIYRVIRSNYRVCEMPYFAKPRRSGESKTGTNLGQYARRGWKYIKTVFRLRFTI